MARKNGERGVFLGGSGPRRGFERICRSRIELEGSCARLLCDDDGERRTGLYS